ncbi:MAG: Hsp20/alpha crystallin family protein [candidate division WOR-3 bacterium]
MKKAKTGSKRALISEIKIVYRKEDFPGAESLFRPGIVNWEPAYDLYIVDDTIFVTVEIPGVRKGDFTVYVGNSHLVISGAKRPFLIENEKKDFGNLVFHTLEISYGRFFRRINFPIPVEPKRGVYKLENGILFMKFPLQKEHIVPIEEA